MNLAPLIDQLNKESLPIAEEEEGEEDGSIATQEDADEGCVHIDDDMHCKVFERREAEEL